MEGREYFDAKFDGLKDLIASQNMSMTNHITAVSRNVGRLEDALDNHKESSSAHGLESSNKAHTSIVSWIGLALACALGVFELVKGVKP